MLAKWRAQGDFAGLEIEVGRSVSEKAKAK
jgi:hypothetical protein